MLNRYLAVKRAERLGDDHAHKERRPHLASECTVLSEAERWRREIIREVATQMSQIQDGSLGEHRIRDLNDHINKLLREKSHWERQIHKLGGPNYAKTTEAIRDSDGKRAWGADGYYYFGAARELPGVRAMFEKRDIKGSKVTKVPRDQLYRAVNAEYYGFNDEDDGLLLKLEHEAEMELVGDYDDDADDGSEGNAAGDGDVRMGDAQADLYRAHVVLPTEKEIQDMLLEKRKAEILAKYAKQ